jgi:tRNA(His) 5'-end guanylyltransferase
MAINAVLAIIADSGRAIVFIYTEGEEINYFLLYLFWF